MGSQQDAELVLAYRSGDRSAGEQLVDRYYDKILKFCRNKAPSAANDLAQRCFLGALEGLDKLRDPTAFRSYLFAVACNQLRKHYRSSRVEGERLDLEVATSLELDPTPSQIMAKGAERRLLLEGLRRIPVEYQIVLELVYWEGMRGADVAEVLDLPVGTAKTRIRRGRQLLVEAISSLEAPGNMLESTISDLDGWAEKLRAQLER